MFPRRMTAMNNNLNLMGIAGTVLSAVGASISVTELQAIVSIIITVAGFLLGVVLPWIIKIVKAIKKAKEDGVITDEEKEEIINVIGEAGKEIKQGAESLKREVSDKSEEVK